MAWGQLVAQVGAAQAAAHTGKTVEMNVDSEFGKVTLGSEGQDTKKGRNFRATIGPDGKTTKISFEASGQSDYDATGAQGSTDQQATSYRLTPSGLPEDGQPSPSLNGNQLSTYVLPNNRGDGRWDGRRFRQWNIEGAPHEEGPFYERGVTPLDLAEITTPTGGKTYAVLGDTGPWANIGEISPKAASNANVNAAMAASGQSGRFSSNNGYEMIGNKLGGLQYNVFPGSGQAVRDLIAKKRKLGQTINDKDIQELGKAAAENAERSGGVPITTGVESVVIGKEQQPATNAGPMSMHLGDCPMKQGSDSVSILLLPASRIGDRCTCGMAVITGEESVLFGGNPTSLVELPPSKQEQQPKRGSAAAANPPPFGGSNLKRGASGGAIANLQQKLGVGENGVFGPQTEAAVRSFQRSNGMTPDGVVGGNTWRALFK